MQSQATSDRLLERDAELEAIERSLARAVDGVGELIVVDGPAGVGKTSLLDAARAAAADGGPADAARPRRRARARVRVRRRAASSSTRWCVRTTADLFTGAARFAAPVLGLELPGVERALRRPVRRAARPLLADREPVGGAAAGAARRRHPLGRHGVAGRPRPRRTSARGDPRRADRGEPDGGAARDARDAPPPRRGARHAAGPEAAERGRRRPLSIRRFAPGADDSQCRACHAATGGNPFLLRELARSAVGGDGSLDSQRVLEQSPERVTQEVRRLGRLPGAAVRLAAGRRGPRRGRPARPAARLAEIDPDGAAEAVGRPWRPTSCARRFRRSSCTRSSSSTRWCGPRSRRARPGRRSRDHSRAAPLLDLEAGSPELVAAQLLRCQPARDPWAYERLVVAARLASARGAADAATLYLRRAIDKPPPPPSLAGALLDLAAAEFRNIGAGWRSAAARGDGRRARPGAALPRDDAARRAARRPGQVADAVELLEEHVDALADRPDLRATGGGGARRHHADRSGQHGPRAARVVERLRRRVDAGEEPDLAVLGTISRRRWGWPASRPARWPS